MQISCTICRELFNASSVIVATECGHTYHHDCLMRWAQRQQTCPQCRAQLLCKPIRVYFNIEDEIDNANDAELMRTKIGEWRRKFDTLHGEFQVMLAEIIPLKSENNTLKERVSELESAITIKNSTIHALKQKIIIQSQEGGSLVSRLKDIEAQLSDAKDELNLLRSVQIMVYGTQKDVENAVSNTPYKPQSIRQLCTYVEVLKGQCEKNSLRYKKLQMDHKPLIQENERLRDKITEVQDKLENALAVVAELQAGSKKSSSPTPPKAKPLAPITENTIAKKEVEEEENVVMKSLNIDIPMRVIDNMKARRPDARVKQRPRLLPSKMFLARHKLLAHQISTDPTPPSGSFGFDGMGGSKRVSLATPTPPEELREIYRRRDQTKPKPKTDGTRTRPSEVAVTPDEPLLVDLDESYIDID